MLRTHPLAHLGQQFLTECLAAQTPPAHDPLEVRAVLADAAQLHALLELIAPSGAVLGDSMLPQQPVHAQPGPPTALGLEVLPVTAPAESREPLFARKQLCPRRVQVNIIAD